MGVCGTEVKPRTKALAPLAPLARTAAALLLALAGAAGAQQAGHLLAPHLQPGKPLPQLPECPRSEQQGKWVYAAPPPATECAEALVAAQRPLGTANEVRRIFLAQPPALSKEPRINVEVQGGTLVSTVVITRGLATQVQDVEALARIYGPPTTRKWVSEQLEATGKSAEVLNAEWMRPDGSLLIFWGLTVDAETGGLGVYSPAKAREILAERKREASAGKKE